MKNTLVLFGIAFLAGLSLSSWTSNQDDKQTQPKKSRHIKMVKIENGKKLELDTVITGDEVFVWNGDTINHKRMKDGEENDRVIYLNHQDVENFPPMPPMPPMPHMRMMKMKHSGRMINLNDPSVISFKKKNLRGGREKIEIIRNKSEESENMNFEIEMPDPVMAPGPPQPRGFRYEFNDAQKGQKKMRKEIRVEVTDDGQTEEEVTTEETK